MEDFGQRISEASNKEEMLTYRQKLSDLKQETLNLQEAFLQEQGPFVAGMVRTEWLHQRILDKHRVLSTSRREL